MLSVWQITCSQVIYHFPLPLTPHVICYPCTPLSLVVYFIAYFLLCLSVQDGESALQIAVCRGHLDVVKILVQAYRDLHMESEIDQYYMDLADDYNHDHVVGYLSSEFPSLKRKVCHHSLHWHTPTWVFGHTICCCLTVCQGVDTHCLCRGVHTVVCSSMPAGASATASTH